jgi:hypothetical protein
MSEGPIPNSWKEAIPVVIWVVLVLAFGFLFAESLGELFKDPLWRAGFALTAMVGFLAMLIYRKWLNQRFRNLSGGSILAAIITVLSIMALSPFIAEKRFPFSTFFHDPATREQIEAATAPIRAERDSAVRERDAARQQIVSMSAAAAEENTKATTPKVEGITPPAPVYLTDISFWPEAASNQAPLFLRGKFASDVDRLSVFIESKDGLTPVGSFSDKTAGELLNAPIVSATKDSRGVIVYWGEPSEERRISGTGYPADLITGCIILKGKAGVQKIQLPPLIRISGSPDAMPGAVKITFVAATSNCTN